MTMNSVLYHVFYVAEKYKAASWNDCVVDGNSVFWLVLQ